MSMRRSRNALSALAIVAIIAGFVGVAQAQPKKLSRIAVGAIGEIGDTEGNQKIVSALEESAVRLALAEVIPSKHVKRSLERAGKPQLFACEGDTTCLATMGRLVGAERIIGVEIGGLGETRVLHLKLVDVRTGKAVRSTTSRLEGDALEDASLVELLAPRRFRGRLTVRSKVDGATIVVNAKVVGKTPARAIPLTIGTHALRVTHPSYRDDVRFIEIEYDKTTTIDVNLRALDVSRQELAREGAVDTSKPAAPTESRPWYGRWYVVAGIGAVVLTGSVALWSARASRVDADRQKDF